MREGLLTAEAAGVERPRIQRSLLSQQVARIIREQILTGRLLPASRITQGDWAARLGVSRMPIRDAISMLCSEGLLVQMPGGSAEVAQMDIDDVADTFYLNAIVVALAHRAAAGQITDAELAGVRRRNDAMGEAIARGDVAEASRLNWAMHSLISRASKSTRLIALLRILAAATPQSSFELLPDWPEQAFADHLQIIDALEHRDADRTFQLTQRHVAVRTEPLVEQLASRIGGGERRRSRLRMVPTLEPATGPVQTG